MAKGLHYISTLDDTDFKKKLENQRRMILDSGKIAEKEAAQVQNAFKNIGGTVASLGVAVSFAAITNELYRFSDSFNKSMREVSTISTTVTDDLDGFKKQVIELTQDIPVLADEAAKSLYQIVSAGHDGANGMKVLEVSAKAAIGGVTETVTAADAITTVLNAYKKGSEEAESISDQLFTTVRLGKTTFGELGRSISQAVPIAASFGIETEQVLAAVATLTKSGTPTAQAMTQIRASIIAASKVLGDGYFQTHTFQEGLAEIAERAGGSEAKLRALIPEIEAMNGVLGLTGINAKTAASDLMEMSNSAGASGAAYEKMMQDTDKQLVLLKNNFLATTQGIGQGMLDITGSVAKAMNEAFKTGDMERLIKMLGVLIVTYGTYKTTLIATNAVQRVSISTQYAAEIAELTKLLPVKQASANTDITEAVAKGRLSQASAEQVIAIRAEVAAELELLKLTAQKLSAEQTEAAFAHKNALQRALNSKAIVSQRQMELSLAQLCGDAKQIEIAQTALASAEEERHIAVKGRKATADTLSIAKSRANSAATAVYTMQTNINSAATKGATVAKNLMTAATGRLTKAFHSMKLAFASNPLGMVLTGITLAITAFSMFRNKVDDTADSVKGLAKAQKDAGEEFDKEAAKVQALQDVMNNSKVAYDERKRALNELKSIIPGYNAELNNEGILINNNTEAIKQYLVQLERQIRLKAATEGLEEAYKKKFLLEKDYDTKYKDWSSKNTNSAYHDKPIIDVVGMFGGRDLQKAEKAKDEAKQKLNDIETTISSLNSEIEKTADNTGGATNGVKSFSEQVQAAASEITTLKAKLVELRTGKGESEDFAKDITETNKALKEAESRYALLSGIDSKASPKDYSSEVVDLMLKTEQMKIEVMQEGRAKELAQIELTRQEKLAAIDKEQKDIEAKLKEQGKQLAPEQKTSFDTQRTSVGLSANKDTVAVNKKYDDEIADGWRALTDVFLSEEEKRTGSIKNEYDSRRKWLDDLSKGGSINREEYVKMSLQIDASEAQAELQPLLDQYQTYADKRKKIEEKFQAERKTLQNEDGSLKKGVTKGNVDELDKAKKKALQSLKFDEAKEGIDLTKLFGNLDNLTLSSMKTLRDKIKVWIDEAGNSLSPEDLKVVSDAFLKLEIKIADKDPFYVLKSSIADYKKSTKEVTEAQELYNKALRENGKDSEVAKQAAEKLTQAQEDRAASLAKANEAIKSVASDGQQIVGAAQDVISILSDLGVKVPEEVGKAIGGIGQVMDGLGSIDLMQPMTIVTGAVKMIGGLITTVTSLFNGDNKRNAEIERLQERIDALGKSYDALEKAAEKAYSTDASDLLEQQNKLIANQKKLIQMQIAEEEAKKDTDDGKIKEWKKQLDELDEKIADNKDRQIEVTLGSDWKSDVDSFVSYYLDSLGKVGTGAADFAKQTKKNIVTELLKKDIGDAVEKMRAQVNGLMADGDLSEADMSEIDRLSEEVGRIMDQRGKAYEKILGNEEKVKNSNSLAGQITGSVATEASVAELGGLFRSQTDSLLRIDSKLDLGFGYLTELARSTAAIEFNTRATSANTAQTVQSLTSGFTAMHSELIAIKNNTAKDKGSYGN